MADLLHIDTKLIVQILELISVYGLPAVKSIIADLAEGVRDARGRGAAS